MSTSSFADMLDKVEKWLEEVEEEIGEVYVEQAPEVVGTTVVLKGWRRAKITPYHNVRVAIEHFGIPITPIPKARIFRPSFTAIERRGSYDLDTRLSHAPTLIKRYPPSFCFHALSIVVNSVTQERPPVETGGDCWIGLRGVGLCVAVGAQIRQTEEHAVYLVHLYGSLERKEIVDVGLLVVPTRNTIEGTIPGDRALFRSELEELQGYATKETVEIGAEVPVFYDARRLVPSSAHFEVQLTFGPKEFPLHFEAESIFTSADFRWEMRYVPNWDNVLN